MPRMKRAGTSRLESRLGFSGEELTTTLTIDKEALNKIEESSKEKAVIDSSIEKSDLLNPKLQSDWQEAVAENILAEIISYETISQYRTVLSEDFIEKFYINERNFLKQVKQVFDNYLAKEHINIISVLKCFGYENIAEFIEDILSSTDSYSQVLILREEDLEIENAYHRELSLYLMSELPMMDPENAEMGKIYLEEDSSYLVRGFDKKTIYRGFLEDLDFSDLSSKINHPFFKGSVIEILSNRGHISSALIVCRGEGFIFTRRVDGSFKKHVFKQDDKVECFLKKLPSQSGFIEDKENIRVLIKDIVMIRPKLSEYRPPNMNIPRRVMLERLNAQSNDSKQILEGLIECLYTNFEGRTELLEALLACDFALKNMFLYYENSTFLVDRARKKLSSKFINAVQNKALSTDLIQLAARARTLVFSDLCKKIDKLGIQNISTRAHELYLIARKGSDRLNQLKINGYSLTDPSYQVIPPKSVDHLSGVVGAAALAMSYLGGSNDDPSASPLKVKKGHFLGVPADLCIQLSFSQCLQTIQGSGWSLVYRRANGKRKRMNLATMNNFEEDDFAEIYYNRHLLCTLVPQNIVGDSEDIFNGVGIIVSKLEPKQIALITRILIGGLAKSGKKEIYISYNTASKGSKETSAVLMYAEAVLDAKAIPLLVDDTRTSKPEESRIALQSLPCSEAQSNLLSDYDVILEKIYREQEEDKPFLSEFALLLAQSPGSSLESWTKEAIAFRLTEIMLHRHNLALDEFMEKMIDYVRKTISSEMPSQKGRDAIKKEISKTLQPFYGIQNSGVSFERWGATIFNLVAKKLGSAERISDDEIKKFQDERFLKQFYAWLEKLGSYEESDYLLLWDLRTFDEFNELQALTRFREILLSSPDLAIKESYFLTRIKHFIKLLGPEFVTGIDREDISLRELLDGLLFMSTQKAENDTKFLNYFDSALENFPFSAARGEGLIIEDSAGAILHETEILQRLKEICVVHHNIHKKEFIARLELFVGKLNLGLVVSGAESYEDKELVAKLITALELRRQKDSNFLEAFDNIFLRDTSSESGFYRFTMIDPDTQESDEQEELNEYDIASRLVGIFINHGNIDKPGFLKRFKVLAEKLNLKLPFDIDRCTNKDLGQSVKDLLSGFKKKKVDNEYFLEKLERTLGRLSLSSGGSIIMEYPNAGERLYEVDILKRLEEIALVDRTIDEKAFFEILRQFTKVFSIEMYKSVVSDSEISPLKLMEKLQFSLQKRKEQDYFFIETLNKTLESREASPIKAYAITMVDPNTGEMRDQDDIMSQLADIFFERGNMDRATFFDRFSVLAKRSNIALTLGSEDKTVQELQGLVKEVLLRLKHRTEQDKAFLQALNKKLTSRAPYSSDAICMEYPGMPGPLSESGILRYLRKIVEEHRTIDEATLLRAVRQFAQALPSDMLENIDLELIINPLDLIEKLLGVLINSRKQSEKTTPAGTVDDVRKGFPQFSSESRASVAYRKEREPLQNLISDLKAEIALDSSKEWRYEEFSHMTKIYDKQTLVFIAAEKAATKLPVSQESVSSISVEDIYVEVHRHNDSDVTKAVNAMAKTMQTMRKPVLKIEVVTKRNQEEIIAQYVCSALNKNLFPEVILNGEKILPQMIYDGLLKRNKDLAKQYGKECRLASTGSTQSEKRGRKEDRPPKMGTSSCAFLSQKESNGSENYASPDQNSHLIPGY